MIYESFCEKCNTMHEYSAKVADMYDTPKCCGKATTFGIFSAPQVGAMSWGREKAVTMMDGTYIETGAEYKRYMKENNKIPADEGAQEAERAKKNKAEKFDKEVEHTVRKAYQELSA